MEVRKLEISEHQNTRKLWELVFKEDTNSFLDYYYTEKTNENEIYVIEEANEIRGMLQLNPYTMKMGSQEFKGHYIVAVATQPEFRGQGIMKRLLHRSLQDMYKRKEAFTFLMPAAEAIYLPFDFRYIYKQRQGKIQVGQRDVTVLEWCKAKDEDCAVLADFAMHYLRDKDVYVKRDSAYYQRLIRELESENGGIVLVKDKDTLIGFYLYTNASEYIIKEPLFSKCKEAYLPSAIGGLTGNQKNLIKCIAYDGAMEQIEEKPMIMARILCPEIVLKEVKVNMDVQMNLAIQDPIISENNKVLRLSAKSGDYLSVQESTREADITLSIAELTSILFGYEKNEKVAMLMPLKEIFLNEVV